MAKSQKKSAKKVVLAMDPSITGIREVVENISKLTLPDAFNERFDGQLAKVGNRLNKIADSLEKAIALDATKEERVAKKTERLDKRRTKLTEQLKTTQTKLDALDE